MLLLDEAPLAQQAESAEHCARSLLPHPAPLGGELRAGCAGALQAVLSPWQQFEQPPVEAVDALNALLQGPLADQWATGEGGGEETGAGELGEDEEELGALVRACCAHFAEPAMAESLSAAPPAPSAFMGTLGLSVASVLSSCAEWAGRLYGGEGGQAVAALLLSVATWPGAPLRARLMALRSLELATRFPAVCDALLGASEQEAAASLTHLLLSPNPDQLCAISTRILRRLRVWQLCSAAEGESGPAAELACELRTWREAGSGEHDPALASLMLATPSPAALAACAPLRSELAASHWGLTILAALAEHLPLSEAHPAGLDALRASLLGVPALHALLSPPAAPEALAGMVSLARRDSPSRRHAATLLCAPGAVEALVQLAGGDAQVAPLLRSHALEALEALLGDDRRSCLDAWLQLAPRIVTATQVADAAGCAAATAVRELASAALPALTATSLEALALQLLPVSAAAAPIETASAPAEAAAEEQPAPASGALPECAWRGALCSLRLLRLRCASSPLACAALLGADAFGVCARLLRASSAGAQSAAEATALSLLEEMRVGTALAAAQRAHRDHTLAAEAASLAASLQLALRRAGAPVRCTQLLQAAVLAHAAAVQSHLLHGAAAPDALHARLACAELCHPHASSLILLPLLLLAGQEDKAPPPITPLRSFTALTLLGDLLPPASSASESAAAFAVALSAPPATAALARLLSVAASSSAAAPRAAGARALARLAATGEAGCAAVAAACAQARAECEASTDAGAAARLGQMMQLLLGGTDVGEAGRLRAELEDRFGDAARARDPATPPPWLDGCATAEAAAALAAPEGAEELCVWRVTAEGAAWLEEGAKRRRILRADLRARRERLERPDRPDRLGRPERERKVAISRTTHVDEFQAREAARKAEGGAGAAASLPLPEEEQMVAAPQPPAPPASSAPPKMLSIRFGAAAAAPAPEVTAPEAPPPPEAPQESYFGMQDAEEAEEEAPEAFHQPPPPVPPPMPPPAPPPSFIPGLGLPGAAPSVIPGVGLARGMPPVAARPVPPPAPPPGPPPSLQRPQPPPGPPPAQQQQWQPPQQQQHQYQAAPPHFHPPQPPPQQFQPPPQYAQPPPPQQVWAQPPPPPAAVGSGDFLQQLFASPEAITQLVNDPVRLRALLEQYPALQTMLMERLRAGGAGAPPR